MISLTAAGIRRCRFLNRRKLERVVRFTLKSVGVKEARLSIAFISDGQIKRLNRIYRGKKKPTDVLAFSMREGRRLKRDTSILGDIAISVDRARKQAKRFGSTFKKELYLYVIHGILHLTGYDDEKAVSRRSMRRKEKEILDRLWQRADL